MAAFQFYLQSGKQKTRLGGGRQLCWFCPKIPLWKGKCEAVRCCDATASSLVAEVRGGVLTHFHAVAIERLSSMRNWLFDPPRRILYEQSPWCQRKEMSMLLNLLFTCLVFSGLGEFGLSV
jgi:hypothetical protein